MGTLHPALSRTCCGVKFHAGHDAHNGDFHFCPSCGNVLAGSSPYAKLIAKRR